MNSWIAAVINAMSRATPPDSRLDENSPFHYIRDTAGIHVAKTVKLTGSGAQTIDLFDVTDINRIMRIAIRVLTVTDSTTLTGVKFETDDGTAQDDITGTVSMSSTVAGSLAYKDASAASGLVYNSAAAAGIAEPASNKNAYQPFFVWQKTGDVSTVIRIAFTGDGATDVDVEVELHYVPFGDTASIAAVA